MSGRRVAITGLGVLSAHGRGAGAVFDAIVAGRSAIRRLSLSSRAGAFEIVGAGVEHVPVDEIPRPQRPACDRAALYALVAADDAIADAGLALDGLDRERVGVSVGTSLGGAISQEEAYADIFERRATRLPPYTLVRVMYNGPAAQIAMRYGLAGPSTTYTTTCSSSAISIGEAARTIRAGDADVMIAGGTEAPFAYVSIKAWLALQVLAPELPGDPAASCRPFSADRNGTVLGDGAAFVVLEAREHAVARGARIYAELAGFGQCNDPGHVTQPSAEAQARSMRLALRDAGLSPDAVDYVNAHGTGTVLNDVAETRAIRQTFGAHASSLAVSSTKSTHGHLVGAAGAIECVVTTLALHRQVVPPTAHLTTPDPACDLDYVPREGRPARVRAAISNSFAVGGSAATLAVVRA